MLVLQSSQLAGPLWTDPGIQSGFCARELISTLKKKKCRRGITVEHSLKILASEEKAASILASTLSEPSTSLSENKRAEACGNTD